MTDSSRRSAESNARGNSGDRESLGRSRAHPEILRDVGLSERLERLYDAVVDENRRLRRSARLRRELLPGSREKSQCCGVRQHRIGGTENPKQHWP